MAEYPYPMAKGSSSVAGVTLCFPKKSVAYKVSKLKCRVGREKLEYEERENERVEAEWSGVEQWRLLGIRKGPLSKGNPGGKKVYWITFAIPVGLVPLLETVAHRPYCLSGRLGVMRRGGQRPGGVEPRR
ncbi:unnamed protein product [Orchesella dallaii]|uniref:Uncharacterized protein n=1 Tax=Orchesella dallaii TaxID=48710 RepID=A0ABP1Q5Q6_9HEXA